MNRRGFFALCTGVTAAALPLSAAQIPAIKSWSEMDVREREVFRQNCEAAWNAAQAELPLVQLKIVPRVSDYLTGPSGAWWPIP